MNEMSYCQEHTHIDIHTGLTAPPGPLKWSAKNSHRQ